MKPTIASDGQQPEGLRQLERLFDAALDAVIGMSGEGVITAWNATAAETFGWSRAEATGKTLAELIIPVHLRAAHWSGLRRYKQTGAGPVINSRTEVTAIRRDGTEFPVELTVIPIANETGEIFYAFLRDISDRKEAERAARQRALEAHVLYEAAMLVAEGGTAGTLLGRCLEKICQVTNWTVGHVYFPDDPLNPLRLLPADIWYTADARLEGLREAAGSFRFEKGEGLPGRIWASGRPEWVEDIAQAASVPRRGTLMEFGLKSAFGFPVFLQGQLQAVLEFFSPNSGRPDDVMMLVAHSLAEQLGRVLERQRALEHQQALSRELDHRVGNSLAVMASVFRRTAERSTNIAELKTKFEARLHGLARGHKLLTDRAWQSASIEQIVTATVMPLCDPAHFAIGGPEVDLPGGQVLTLAMALQELALNGVSHGSLSGRGGKLSVTWHQTVTAHGLQVVLDWRETGGPPVQEPRQRGYGLVMVERLCNQGLKGNVEFAFESAGLHVTIEINLDPFP